MTPGFIGLGSNIGDRRAHLEDAARELESHGVHVLASSSVYETEPVGLVLDQREFYNACLRVETAHGPLVVDINDFPSFAHVPDANTIVAAHIVQVASRQLARRLNNAPAARLIDISSDVAVSA